MGGGVWKEAGGFLKQGVQISILEGAKLNLEAPLTPFLALGGINREPSFKSTWISCLSVTLNLSIWFLTIIESCISYFDSWSPPLYLPMNCLFLSAYCICYQTIIESSISYFDSWSPPLWIMSLYLLPNNSLIMHILLWFLDRGEVVSLLLLLPVILTAEKKHFLIIVFYEQNFLKREITLFF